MLFLKYFYNQVICAAADVIAFFLLVNFANVAPIPANVATKIFGATLAFFLHRQIFFGASTHNTVAHTAKYLISFGLNVLLSTTILGLLSLTEGSVLVCKVIADIMTFIIFFFISRDFIFR